MKENRTKSMEERIKKIIDEREILKRKILNEIRHVERAFNTSVIRDLLENYGEKYVDREMIDHPFTGIKLYGHSYNLYLFLNASGIGLYSRKRFSNDYSCSDRLEEDIRFSKLVKYGKISPGEITKVVEKGIEELIKKIEREKKNERI